MIVPFNNSAEAAARFMELTARVMRETDFPLQTFSWRNDKALAEAIAENRPHSLVRFPRKLKG